MVAPIVTVVIPNYNGRSFLPRLMESLHNQTDSRLVIIVVDDTSSDDSVSYLREEWPDVRMMCNEQNLGFTGSCNRGMQEATTPFVVLLNNDTHVAPDWLAEGIRPFDEPNVAAVASLVLLADPPHLIDTAGDVYSVAGGALKRQHLQDKDSAVGLDRCVFSACGASAFYRREAVAAAGWLDDTLESYYEDVDLGFRLAWAGHRCVFAPDSVCYHHLSSSYDPKGWRYHFNSSRNAETVWWSHMPSRLRWKHFFAHTCFLALQAMNKLRQGCLLSYLAGKLAFLRQLGHVRRKRRENARAARVTANTIESMLVRDWWDLHIRSRLKKNSPKRKSTG